MHKKINKKSVNYFCLFDIFIFIIIRVGVQQTDLQYLFQWKIV